MKKILLFLFLFTFSYTSFGQRWSDLIRLLTVTDSTSWATFNGANLYEMNKKVTAEKVRDYVRNTNTISVNSSPDSVITVGSDQLVSKTPTTPFTSIAITSKDAGSVFWKQKSTGNFSASNKFYFDSTNTRICIGGTGVSHSPQSRVSIVADSSRTATKYMFNIVDPSINKNRTDWAKATDTSSFSYYITENTGKGILKYVNQAGAVKFLIDSTGNVQVGGTGLPSYALGVTGNVYISGLIISSSRVSGTECVFNEFIAPTGQNMPISTCSNNKEIYFGNNNGSYDISNYYAKFIPVDTGVAGGFGFYPYNIKQANNDSITAAGGIPATKLASEIRFNQAAAIDISANPQIADGFDGQIIEITGLSDVNTLKLDDGDGLQLAGGNSFTLGSGDVISLKYILSLDLWVERFRSDN